MTGETQNKSVTLHFNLIKVGANKSSMLPKVMYYSLLNAAAFFSSTTVETSASNVAEVLARNEAWLGVCWKEKPGSSPSADTLEAVTLTGDAIERTVLATHPTRGPLILTNYVESKYHNEPIVSFDVICGDHRRMTGRAVIRFTNANELRMAFRFTRPDGSFAFEFYTLVNAESLGSASTLWWKRATVGAQWILASILVPLIATLIVRMLSGAHGSDLEPAEPIETPASSEQD